MHCISSGILCGSLSEIFSSVISQIFNGKIANNAKNMMIINNILKNIVDNNKLEEISLQIISALNSENPDEEILKILTSYVDTKNSDKDINQIVSHIQNSVARNNVDS